MSIDLTKDEMQAVVDRRFGKPVVFSLGEVNETRESPRDNRTPLDILIAREVAELHIADRVAEYMAVHCEDQRLTLRRLGADGVGGVISKVLDVLPTVGYQAKETAHALNLDPGTYNRIAGQTGFSDIARCIAQLCWEDEQLMEFVCECGFWEHICRLQQDGRR